MHYIIGTKIQVSTYIEQEPLHERRPVNDMRPKRKNRLVTQDKTPFRPDVPYTLNQIRPVDGKMVYQFSNNLGEDVPVTFNSVTEADTYIANILGEPDPQFKYQQFHFRRRD